MAFHSGRVSFTRFKVTGDAPKVVDETALGTLSDYKFKETEIGAPEELEAGFTTGDHLFDVDFTYEKNGYGDMLLFALRMDTNKVPADVKQAYKRINEKAAAGGNPSGFATRVQKKEATDMANDQVREELASGKYRRSKTIPVLWDLKNEQLYCGALGNRVREMLAVQMHNAFNVELNPLTSGSIGWGILSEGGKQRDFEDTRPSAFTPPPPEATPDEENVGGPIDLNIPVIPWAAGSFESKDFLGNEFLLWLWYMVENHEGMVNAKEPDGKPVEIALMIDKSLDMECAWAVRGKQSLRGDGPHRLPEAGRALMMGKWPRKFGMIIAEASGGESRQWELTLQGDRFDVSGAALPEIEETETERELIEQRVLSVRALAQTLDSMYETFLDHRFGGGWSNKRQTIREWVHERVK